MPAKIDAPPDVRCFGEVQGTVRPAGRLAGRLAGRDSQPTMTSRQELSVPTSNLAPSENATAARARLLRRFAIGLSLVAAGVMIGRLDLTAASTAFAQDDVEDAEEPISEEAANEIRALNRAVDSARDELERADRYRTATTTPNVTLILSGGGDAVADLEAGEGVDPETYAGLYAGAATEEVKRHLTFDDENRLLYKGNIVRMYSKSRLKDLYDNRNKYAPSAR